MTIVDRAKAFAIHKHLNVLDDNGVPFIFHPIQACEVITLLCPYDENLQAAALLHDTVEDCKVTYEELVEEFNQDVADLVMEVTHEGKKDSVGHWFPRLKTQRGILLKFADRASNLSRMNSWSADRIQHYLNKSKFWKDKP